ncbi:MAG: hypothetical protein OEL84_06630 [Nitrosopumilus sp.]|nr:hypothetical protein [Nitrosopumilus sp.]
MKCEHCDKILTDDENVVTNYLIHKRICHKDELSDEEKMFGEYKKKMIRQKEEYVKFKKIGDSDLIFNSRGRDV